MDVTQGAALANKLVSSSMGLLAQAQTVSGIVASAQAAGRTAFDATELATLAQAEAAAKAKLLADITTALSA